MWHVGPKCREWRMERKLSQTYIAKASGLSRSMVCRFEKGELSNNFLLFTYIRLGMPIEQDTLIRYLASS